MVRLASVVSLVGLASMASVVSLVGLASMASVARVVNVARVASVARHVKFRARFLYHQKCQGHPIETGNVTATASVCNAIHQTRRSGRATRARSRTARRRSSNGMPGIHDYIY